MRSVRSRLTLGIVCLGAACLGHAQSATEDLTAKFKALPRVTDVRTFKTRSGEAAYDVTFEQPVDHQDPNGPKFGQHVFVAHVAFDKPVFLGTEGYAASGPEGGELRKILGGANLITPEHRYFGRSIPSPLDWKYLTIKNAADDMHDIVMTFKQLYKSKWVASGVSKGGQTSLFYKCYYPRDVDATVAYVAPVNIGQEDPRLNHFFEVISDEATRQKIKDFQIALLERQDEIIPLLKLNPKDYSMGIAKAYEYGVLEFPFAFWQYGSNPAGVPDANAPLATLVDEYKKIGAMYYYSDAGIRQFEAFQYQAFTEIGYYNYDITDFKPYLKNNPNPTNMDLCPPGTKEKIVYNPLTLAFVFHYLQYEAQNVIFVYGETDAWSATQMQLIGRTNAVKIVVKNASHSATISAASPEQKDLVFSNLEKWLGIPLVRN